MSDLDTQTSYWNAVAAAKTFTHPLHMPWLNGVDRNAAILDYGCGYGRTMQALKHEGFSNLAGIDSSPEMIARARTLNPDLHFSVLDAPPALALPDASIDVVVLFAVLTCIPSNGAQRNLIGELARVLRPGGMLYLSDLLLQDDERNLDRYAQFAEHYGTYGVFETNDGAVCRHHSPDWFATLLADLNIADTRKITVTTMNGNESAGIQIRAHTPTKSP
jgi:SAM-dependent methyltransferase